MSPEELQQLLECYVNEREKADKPLIKEEKKETAHARKSCDSVDGHFRPHYEEILLSIKPSHLDAIHSESVIEVATSLITMADDFEKSRSTKNNNIVSSHREIPQDITPEEAETLKKIYSENFSVATIVSHLSKSVTPHTFKETIKFIGIHATSVPLEMALVMEVTTQLYRTLGRSRLSFIPSVFSEMFHTRANMGDLMNLENKKNLKHQSL